MKRNPEIRVTATRSRIRKPELISRGIERFDLRSRSRSYPFHGSLRLQLSVWLNSTLPPRTPR